MCKIIYVNHLRCLRRLLLYLMKLVGTIAHLSPSNRSSWRRLTILSSLNLNRILLLSRLWRCWRVSGHSSCNTPLSFPKNRLVPSKQNLLPLHWKCYRGENEGPVRSRCSHTLHNILPRENRPWSKQSLSSVPISLRKRRVSDRLHNIPHLTCISSFASTHRSI